MILLAGLVVMALVLAVQAQKAGTGAGLSMQKSLFC